MTTMTLERFDDLATAYGAAIFLWPAEEQAAAEALAASPEADAILARERALDEALDEWEAPEPSQALMARILGDAAEVSAATVAPVAEPPPVVAEKPGFFARFFGDIGWRPAGAMTACLAIGFAVGLSGTPDSTQTEDKALAAEDNAVIATFFGDEDESDPFDLEML